MVLLPLISFDPGCQIALLSIFFIWRRHLPVVDLNYAEMGPLCCARQVASYFVSDTEDDDFEGNPDDSGEESPTLGGQDDTLNSYSSSGRRSGARPDASDALDEPDESAGVEDGPQTIGNSDLTEKGNRSNASVASAITSGSPIESAVNLSGNDATVNANLAELAGVPDDAIRPLSGRFALVSKLGKGGMGEVFAARDGMLNRQVAVKVLASGGGEGLARFVREAQVTAQLSHPNVVPVYGLEETDQGSPALTMKLVDGMTFAHYIKQCSAVIGTPDYDQQRHSEKGRIEHFLRVCDAISYSHSRGVIHRDLKPGNLMIGTYGEVYVMDWGIAHLQNEPDDDLFASSFEVVVGAELEDESEETPDDVSVSTDGMRTQLGAILGTPRYMSPEQAAGERVCPKSDQFSLAMVLFEMLTFTAPREIRSKKELIEKVQSNSRRSFSETKQGQSVPLALQAIVERATSKDPADRYPSVEDFSDDLRRYVHGEEVQARPDNVFRAWWRRVQRHPVAVMSALLITIATAAAITTFSLYRGLETERNAAARGQKLSQLVAAVSQRVNEFDTLLFEVEGLLEGVATSSREQLEHAPVEPYKIYQPDDIRKSSEFLERYKQRVSYDNFVVVLPPDTEIVDIQDQVHQLGGLRFVLRDAMFRSAHIDASELDKKKAEAILRAGTPVHWAYIALENGVMINYPGNETYPPDIDARKRPWFISAMSKKNEAVWGNIYPDSTGSGYQMPCNQSFYDRSGNFLGVAGLDISMDTVIQEMEMLEVDGVKETWMMDGGGRVVLSSQERGQKTEVDTLDNKSKELGVLGIPELEAHARKGTTSGFVMDRGDVLVFARLKAVSWILVARIDADSHGL